jgi:hypothetical protein
MGPQSFVLADDDIEAIEQREIARFLWKIQREPSDRKSAFFL